MVSYTPSWKVKSKGAILTLFQDFVVTTTSFLTLLMLYNTSFWKGQPLISKLRSASQLITAALFAVAFPVAGWLADVYFGRFKVRRFGLWLMWIGTLFVATACILSSYYDYDLSTNPLLFILISLGHSFASVGCAAYGVNTIQFGIDQMPDASSEELSAYIHWEVCVTCTACSTALLIILAQVCFINPPWYTVSSMVPMTMLSSALCCEFLLRGWLIIEPGCPNSLRMIYRVLKFAATHKYPIRRRAITYTEDEKPSRIDFAKDKYGGPFTTEQVEDVKTFFRVTVVLGSTITVLIPLFIALVPGATLDLLEWVPCNLVGISKLLGSSMTTFGTEILLLYSFVIHPLFKKQILTMLQRVGVAAFLLVLLTAASLVAQKLGDVPENHNFAPTSYTVIVELIVYNFTVAVVVVLFFVAILEFTCAQSPYSMRGLLLGLMYFITFLALLIAISAYTLSNCNSYFLLQFLCAVVGLIVLCIVARWYKRRRREEEDDQRRLVEEIYSRMLQHQSYGR